MSNFFQKGQTLLIVVLVMVVALTVGLSVASRSIINLRTSTEEENSQRAFSAAEAGVEQAIKTGCITPIPPATGCVAIEKSFSDNISSFKTSITTLEGNQFLINGGNIIEKNDGTDIWLVPHNSDGTPDYTNPTWTGTLTFYWGMTSDVCASDPAVNTMTALEIIVLTGSKANPVSTRYAFDPCPERSAINNFSTPPAGGGTIGGVTFRNKTDIVLSSPGLFIRAVPLYHSTRIGVVGTSALPSQGQKIESVGLSGSTNRKISFYKGYLEIPSEFFPYILFSPK